MGPAWISLELAVPRRGALTHAGVLKCSVSSGHVANYTKGLKTGHCH